MKYLTKKPFQYGDQYFEAGDEVPSVTVYYLEKNFGQVWTTEHIEYITEVIKRED
jgi:hypothetical protein